MSAQVPDPNETISVSDAQMLKELAKIGKGLGGTIGQAAKEDEKKQTGLKGLMSGGLGKLGVIGMAVGVIMGVVKMFISASPMLKSMLKLFQFGIMLILRPIGDFIGFMLRPIMLMVLTKFILPFYQNALPMMQAMGTMVGEVLVPIVEGIITGIIAIGKILFGLPIAIGSKISEIWGGTYDDTLLQEGWTELQTLFGITSAAEIVAVHEVTKTIATMDKNIVSQLQTGWGDLPKLTEQMKPKQIDFNKFASAELTKMFKLLGNNTNVAGVGEANTAVNVAMHRGDVSTMKEMKDLWYKTLMSNGGWTKSNFNKSSNVDSASQAFEQQKELARIKSAETIKIEIVGMNGNYTSAEKYQFEHMVAEVIEKERQKRPR
jgi:hypothetical protein